MGKEWWDEAPLAEDAGDWWKDAPLADAEPKKRTWGEAAQDGASAFGASVNNTLKTLTDLGGTNNPASQFLGENAKTWQGNYSPSYKAELEKQKEEKAALGEDPSYAARAALMAKQTIRNPIEGVGELAGNIAPMLVGGLAGMGAKGMAVLSSAMGAGAVKGGIAETVQNAPDADLMADPLYAEMRSGGMSEKDAKSSLSEQRASYGDAYGKILLGAGIGAAVGRFGSVENAIANMGKGAAGQGFIKSIGKEVATEIPQEMAETYLGNTGAAAQGAKIASDQGVVEAGVKAGILSAVGGGVAGISGNPQVPKPENKPDPVQTILESGSVDDAIAAATNSVNEVGSAWQSLGVTPSGETSSISARQAGQAWQDIAPEQTGSLEQQRAGIEQAGAQASAARDSRLSDIGQQWQGLGITAPQDDLQAQRAGMRPTQDGTTPDLQRVPATSSGTDGPISAESMGNGAVDAERLGADTAGLGNSGVVESGQLPAVDVAGPLSFPFVKSESGTVLVTGNPTEIGAQFPGLTGATKFTDGQPSGVLFGKSAAPVVLAKLESESVKNTSSRTEVEAKAPPDQTPAPAGSEPVAPARVPGAGDTAIPAAGVDQKLIPVSKRNPQDIAYNLPKGASVGGAQEISALFDTVATRPPVRRESVRFAVVGESEAKALKDGTGLDLVGYRHSVDNNGLRHAIKSHGVEGSETARGQLPITKDDAARIPEIVSSFDSVKLTGKDAAGNDLIQYTKRFNGTTYYVEEVRSGRQELAIKTLWKTRTALPAKPEGRAAQTSETISSNPPQRTEIVAPEVSRYNGKFGKGMNRDAARLEAMRLNRTNDGITYTAEEHNDAKLENPYAVVGRKSVEQKQAQALVERAQPATETVASERAKTPEKAEEQPTDAAPEAKPETPTDPVADAKATLDASNVTGKERLDVIKDVKAGTLTAEEVKEAYPTKIEDAGEKIGGARKDRWKDRGLDLTDLDGMSESEGAELATKANVWKPDYEAMAEATEPVTAAMVKTVYDQLAAQPKKNTPDGRRNYVTMMQAVRKAYSEAKSPEEVKQAGDKVKRAIGLYTDDPEQKKQAREVLFSVYKGRSDPFVLGYNELSKAKKMVEDGFPAKGEPWKKRLSIRPYGGQGITSRGIELTLKESADLGTPLTSDQIVSGFFRINAKDGKAVGYAPTKVDAEATAKTIYERDLKKVPADKIEPSRPNLDALKRENLPSRIDRDATAEDFVKDLGFRGVEFGNWAAQDERQRIINMAYDGLMDLATIMGIPPKALSLNGTLGMAFGARGGGKFAAHYEPGKLVINMTKINGGGSMAHEWAHALDHYFGELNQKDAYTTKARGASGWYDEQQYKGLPITRMEKDAQGKWANVTKMRLANLRPEMAKAFDDVMSAMFSGQETKAQMVRGEELAIERYQTLADRETDPDMKAVYQRGIESRKQSLDELRKDPEDKMYPKGRSSYAGQAQALSGKSTTGYWLRPTEMFARAFESWVFDKVAAMGARSDYLVHGVEEDRFAGGSYKGNPYPTGPERAAINAAFDKLASTIKTKETDKGVAMFARGTNKAVTNPKDVVGNQGGRSADDTTPGEFAMAGDMVDGLLVRDEIPNQGSIGSSIDDYTVLPGVREIPLTAFTQLPKLKYYSTSEEARTKRLAEQIKASSEINPLIVVIDKEGPYVLEGGHRFDALRELGKTSFPALVVLDNDSLNEPTAPDSGGAFSRKVDQTETEAFKQWFANSAVVDADGKPLVVYHGTGKDFSSFNADFADSSSMTGVPKGVISLSSSPEAASSYAGRYDVQGWDSPEHEAEWQKLWDANQFMAASKYMAEHYGTQKTVFDGPGQVMPLYVSMKNPMVVDAKGALWKEVPWRGGKVLAHDLVPYARNHGYDGVIIKNVIDQAAGSKTAKPASTIFAFRPEQIKSATGNNGQFDPANPDIRYALGDEAFSLGITPRKFMPVSQVQAAVDELSAKWTDGPAIKVVQTSEDLPIDAPSDARGLIHKGTVYIVAANHLDRSGVARTLAHEAIGHYGLWKMLGAYGRRQFERYLQLALKTGNKPLKEISATVRSMYVDESGKFNLSPEEESHEIAAFAVERAIDPETGEFNPGFGFLKSMFAKVAQFLRDIGINVKFTNLELQGMLVNAMRGLEAGRKLNGGGLSLVAAARDLLQGRGLKAFSEVDDLYALPKSKATDLAQIAKDNDADVSIRTTEFPGGETMHTLTFGDGTEVRITDRKTSPYGQDQQVYGMEMIDGEPKVTQLGRPGDNPEDVQPTDDVWLDVSNNTPAKWGAKAYNIAATYAYNNGKIFIGDPAGLSDKALRRRNEQMLSNALKFGTTEHLAPHPRQVSGDAELGVPPLRWVYGDHVGNIERMIDVSLESLENGAPGAKDDTRYNPDTGEFTSTSGDVVSRKSPMGREPSEYGRGIRQAQAGWRTLARAAFLRSFLGPDGKAEGSGILDRAGDHVARLASDGTGNGPYSPTERIFYARSGIVGQTNPHSWDAPEPSKFDDLVYKLQDKQIDTKRVVEEIRKTGKALADEKDVYLQEELFHGRAAARTEDFVNNELSPLIAEMKMRGIDIPTLDEYLHARHAEEANELIAKRNPDIQDGGSGMTTQVARDYLAKLDPAERKRLEAVAAKVDSILGKTRQMYADYGLESDATVKGWGQMFQHYVPLMREDKDGGMGIGQGFSIKGKETKGRTGSTRKVVDILANIAMQRERAIVRGEKNRVATALVGLAEMNPNEDFWAVGPPPTEKVYDPKTNAVVDRADPLFKSRENVVVAKVKGPNGTVVEKAVRFNEDNERAVRMAAALKNLDAAHLNGLLGVSAKISRYFAAINTQYNPVFGVVNLVRDFQGAILNLTATPLKDKKAEIAGHTLAALKGVYLDARAARDGKPQTSAWAKLWEDFQNEGGQTGYRDMFANSADRAKAIEHELNPTKWMDSPLGKVFTANGTLKVPLEVAQKKAEGLFGWLSDYNLAMENAVRLSAYKVGLEQGMSKQQAASLAKNLTVNFNRKGQVGQQAGAVYAFFNASMQGSARLGKTLFDMDGSDPKTIRLSPTGKKIVYGGILLGVIQSLTLAAAGFDDEEPPDFVRERSLIIPTGGKSYITIPMPLGLHVLPNMGRIPTEFVLGGFKQPVKSVVKLLGLTAGAFNPIGGGASLTQMLAPTAVDPLVALTENKDWTGKPIAKTSYNKATPGHAMTKDTASAPAKVLAEAFNALSGGTKYTAGVFSPTPDQIDYLWGQVTGGVGRELSKAQQSVSALMSGENLPIHKIPLVGRFYGDADTQSAQSSKFYATINRLNEHEAEIKGLRKDRKAADLAEYMRDNPEARMFETANRVELEVQKMRRMKREMIALDAPPERIKALEDRITLTMTRFNERVAAFKKREAATAQ